MIPKEKAEELVQRYEYIGEYVSEITMNYWKEVKLEINKI